MAGGVFAYLGGTWRTAVYHDAWDPTAGVWRDVKEIWGCSFGAWRLHYQRARLEAISWAGTEPLPGDDPGYAITFTANGTAAGTVFFEIRINGTIRDSGFIATPDSRTRGVSSPGGSFGSDVGDIRIYNIRGRLIDTQPIPF